MIDNKTCDMIILLIVASAILEDHKTAEWIVCTKNWIGVSFVVKIAEACINITGYSKRCLILKFR